jgi:thymidylate synthase (FAD)
MTRERRLESLNLTEKLTKRSVNPGAEKWLGEVIPVLDHGFVYLVDYMGDDYVIEQAARVSYGKGTRTVSETRGLIRYLRRHRHTTPFEMVEFKFHARMPIFVARQWVRHRTASINEYSARYSILDREFYVPEPEVIAQQSKSNRQGREEIVDPGQAEVVRRLLIEDALRAYGHYEEMLNDDGTGKPLDPEKPMIARELARMNLTLNYYTQWYWKIDLHNLFHFLKLRMDNHAQWEIRQYANAMSEIVKDVVPFAWEAFVDYEQEATYLSRQERQILAEVFQRREVKLTVKEVEEIAGSIGLTNKRERKELLKKFGELGLLDESV